MDINPIIDELSLRILDEFEAEYGRLPNDKELSMWRIGFLDGMEAIKQVIQLDIENGL